MRNVPVVCSRCYGVCTAGPGGGQSFRLHTMLREPRQYMVVPTRVPGEGASLLITRALLLFVRGPKLVLVCVAMLGMFGFNLQCMHACIYR